MKKVSLLAVLATVASTAAMAQAQTAPCTSPACPKAFQGFHLGANLGYGVGKGTQKYSAVERTAAAVDDTHNTKTNIGVSGVDGGIGVGYTHRLCNWALGLAFDANWANSSGKGTANSSNAATRVVTSRTLQATLKNSLQLYARAGYVIGQMAMPFVGLGWDNSAWRQKVSDTLVNGRSTGYSASKTSRHNGLLWKLGVDFLATKHVVVGFEYTGVSSNRKKLSEVRTGSVAAANTTNNASFKPQYNKFAVTAKLVY